MINLCNRTEFSFRAAFGSLEVVLDMNGKSAGMCDRHGTWGHVQWKKACDKKGIKPIYGVELAIVDDMEERTKQGVSWVRLIANNEVGLKELYELVTLATEKFYYIPRLDWEEIKHVSTNITLILPASAVMKIDEGDNIYYALDPTTTKKDAEKVDAINGDFVACSDNYYPTPDCSGPYQIVCSMGAEKKASAQHIINEYELAEELYWCDQEIIDRAIKTAEEIAESCTVELPKAQMVKPVVEKKLKQMCEEAAPSRGVDLSDPVYGDRLKRELDLIDEKDFADYFYVVADMIDFAKDNMLVGPARGSSCGSLVCYILRITEIDPIPYGLLFERFIDINRADYPDIDIDFPDDRRDMVFDYLKDKYGSECVARLGTINRFKPKSTIGEVAKALNIPAWEMKDLKDSILERSGGDSRANFCIMDTFEQLAPGQRVLEKYPEMVVCTDIEGHAKHTGQHAAGILVTADPVSYYCSVDERTGASMVDKYDAEELNLLKIDALGLRTLSVLQDTLDQIGWTREQLMEYPTDDPAAFKVLNNGQFSGIFQFEGYALQSLTKRITMKNFEDMVSITALARPGPLNSGGATEWLERHSGKSPIEYLHPLAKDITEVTYGVIVYQEQVMQIVRDIGQFSWEETSSIRKAMSKSLGEEYFDKQWKQFKKGAANQGIEEEKAAEIWSKINTMGSWAFNRSHAVAYGLISYWCCLLKGKFHLEFAAASLRHAKDDDQTIKILRELREEGYEYEPFNKELSTDQWSVQDGKLIGGLIGIKGIGLKMAADIMLRREEGRDLTPRHHKLMDNPVTPYDTISEGQDLWGHIYDDPDAYNIASRLRNVEDITDKSNGMVVFIAKLATKNQRDHNEPINIEKRGGSIMQGQTLYLNMTLEDDTDAIMASINRYDYLKWGKKIVDEGKIGDWYIFKARTRKGFRKAYIKRFIKLTGNEDYVKPLNSKET